MIAFARRLAELGGVSTLRAAGVDEEQLEECVRHAATRQELSLTAPPADADELRALYDAAM
jgi:alcohol dehydrogenase class IV